MMSSISYKEKQTKRFVSRSSIDSVQVLSDNSKQIADFQVPKEKHHVVDSFNPTVL